MSGGRRDVDPAPLQSFNSEQQPRADALLTEVSGPGIDVDKSAYHHLSQNANPLIRIHAV
jgi:hypothetical protein